MIDVERLQRLNQLANDLLEHGFAQDREDAMRQADETLRKKSAPAVSITPMTSTPSIDSHGTSKVAQESSRETMQATQHPGYTPDWHTLYRNLNKKIEEQNSQILALIEQIRQMDAAITLLKNRPPTVVQQTVRQAPELPPQMPSTVIPEKQPVIEKKASVDVIDANTGEAIPIQTQRQNSPRTGGYSPKDVSVEKFFYSGTRPQK